MPDWLRGMRRSYEFYIVDPATWNDSEVLENVTNATITHDVDTDTIYSINITCDRDPGECYVRVYLCTYQDLQNEKLPLGTFLIQTPQTRFNGRRYEISLTGYSPLLELKDTIPPVGFTIRKGINVMAQTLRQLRSNIRAPLVRTTTDKVLPNLFTANMNDTWLSFTKDLLAVDKKYLDVDEMGRVLFRPFIKVQAMQPVWIFNDDNSSILYPEVSVDRDLYGIPNVIELVYSSDNQKKQIVIENDDPTSPVSTKARGRRIVRRITNPQFSMEPSDEELKLYAENALKEASCLEYTVTFKHGFCNVRAGECVLLNYKKAGLENVKAKIIRQSISLTPGCPVESTAIYSLNLWGSEL